jgi:hypothetical protein
MILLKVFKGFYPLPTPRTICITVEMLTILNDPGLNINLEGDGWPSNDLEGDGWPSNDFG